MQKEKPRLRLCDDCGARTVGNPEWECAIGKHGRAICLPCEARVKEYGSLKYGIQGGDIWVQTLRSNRLFELRCEIAEARPSPERRLEIEREKAEFLASLVS